MKYLKKIAKILLMTLLVIGMGSCTKDFEEMNKSPNSPVDVPAINIFTNAAYSVVNRNAGMHTFKKWAQQQCNVQYIEDDKYEIRDMSGWFTAPYTDELKNLTIVINKATEDENMRLTAAAMILKAFTFMNMTDLLGDIPMSEALQGFDAEGTIKPVYDTQEDVYMQILADLEAANVLLAGTSVNFGSGDIIYGGDPVLWRKFANSLKLRLLNRCAGTPWSFTYDMAGTQADVTTTAGAAAYAGADAAIATILGNPTQYPVFSSSADDAYMVYPGLPYRHPTFNALYSRTDQGASQTMVNWLKERNDPRLHIYAQPMPSSYDLTDPAEDFSGLEYNGFQNGSFEIAAPFPEVGLMGTRIAYDEFAAEYIMTYDEVEFIKAEYYLRQGQDGPARTAYENGIAANMVRKDLTDGGTIAPSYKTGASIAVNLGITYPVDFSTYLADPLVDWNAAADDAHKFQLICEQRWAAMYPNGSQAYALVRRTGFPARIFEYELEGTVYEGLGLPIRIPYAVSEVTYNPDNLAAAKARQNIELSNESLFSTNGIASQMWWHTRKNPIPTEKDPQIFSK